MALHEWLQGKNSFKGIKYTKLENRDDYQQILENRSAYVPPPILSVNEQRKNLNSFASTQDISPFIKPKNPMITTGTGKFGMTKLSPISDIQTVGVGKTGAVKIVPRQANGIDSVLTGALDSASLGTLNGLTNKLTGNKTNMNPTNNNFAYGAGKMLGYTLPYSGASKVLSPLVKSISNPIVRGIAGVAEGAGTFAAGTGIEDMANGKSWKDTKKDMLINGAIGGGLPLVLGGIGKGISALSKLRKPITQPITPSILNPKGLKATRTNIKEVNPITPIQQEYERKISQYKFDLKSLENPQYLKEFSIGNVEAERMKQSYTKELKTYEVKLKNEQLLPTIPQSNPIAPTIDNIVPQTSPQALKPILNANGKLKPQIVQMKNDTLPLKDRTIFNVSDRKVKAYQYDNPTVKPYMKDEANIMKGEIERGSKPINPTVSNIKIPGGSGQATETIGYGNIPSIRSESTSELNKLGTYSEINKALDDIIHDKGKENYALAKKVELKLDERMTNGYKDDVLGHNIPPNGEYLQEKAFIDGMPSQMNTSTFKKPLLNSKLKPIQEVASTIEPPVIPPTVNNGTDNVSEGVKATQNKYVDNNPIEFNVGKNDKKTSINIRDSFTGKENGQIVAGNHLADTMKKLAPNEQEGIQLFIDSGGNMEHLKEMATHQDPIMDSFIPNTKTTYRDAYNQALNLSPKAMEAAKEAQIYYKESGSYALQTGSTKSVLDNYASRMWTKEPQGVRSEVGRSTLNANTSHAKERTYETIGDGLLNGKQPTTLKANELLSIHNQEMAHANSTRELATSLEKGGIGQYSGKIAPGFKNVDGLSQHIPTKDGFMVKNFVLPEGIANGLKSITDQDFTKKIDIMRKFQKYQGVVKSVDLAVSTFHHITLAAQALYNNKGGVEFAKHWKDLHLWDTPEFNKSELDFVKHTGITTKVSDNMDVLHKLTTTGSAMDKITNLPILKQGKKAVEANNNFLFGYMQRWLKVTDYQNKVMNYVSKHPETVNEALSTVKKDIAKQVNLAYGGLNFKALGKNPSTLGVERMAFLAPDWTESSIRMMGKAFENNQGGKAARQQYLVGLGGGIALTEGLNHILTGHWTDKNPKGHELEVEVQPGVYISMFRSGIGDATKAVSNVITNGLLGGASKTIQGKLAPFARTGVGLASNVDYLGRKISDPKKTGLQNDLNIVKFVGSSAGPIPFGVPSAIKYNTETPATGKQKVIGNLLVDSGAARYAKDFSQTDSTYNDPKKSYDGNWLRRITAPTNEKTQIKLGDKLKTQQKVDTLNSTNMNEAIGAAVKNDKATGEIPYDNGAPTSLKPIFDKYNVPFKQRKTVYKNTVNKIENLKLNPLQQKFNSLSKPKQDAFYSTLSDSEKKLINKVNSDKISNPRY
ncbi:hypothetical protein [Clostridium sp.]